MLASITPLGQRGRRASWTATVIAFVLACVAGAALVGAVLGLSGRLLGGPPGGRTGLEILLGALALGLILELGPGPLKLPTTRRQVNEEWLGRYRGWVTGAGFGGQLGVGVVTVVNSSLLYVAQLAALLSSTVTLGVVIAGCFGVSRAATLLVTAGVDSPERLFALHRRLVGWRGVARGLTLAGQVGLLVGAFAVSL
jgi:hypothetical protein